MEFAEPLFHLPVRVRVATQMERPSGQYLQPRYFLILRMQIARIALALFAI